MKMPSGAKFTDTVMGAWLKYQEILNTLKAEHKIRDEQDICDALHYFSGKLGGLEAGAAFKYKSSKSGGQMVLLMKTVDIAKRRRDLLAQDNVVATQWNSMQAEQC